MATPDPSASGVTGHVPHDSGKYTITSRLEIGQILNAMLRQSSTITAIVGIDEDFFLTSIVAVDTELDHLMLECGPDSAQNERVLRQKTLRCSGHLNKVRIEFGCDHVESAQVEGRSTFRTALPTSLLRLQRREYYRMSMPITPPVKCTVALTRGGVTTHIDLKVLDISCGGISVMTRPELFLPEIGTGYVATIELPGTGVLTQSIEAREAFAATLASGTHGQRSGFSFVSLSDKELAMIQRYILNLERQHNARGRDM